MIARICATLKHIHLPALPSQGHSTNTMHAGKAFVMQPTCKPRLHCSRASAAALAYMTLTDVDLYVADVYHNQRQYFQAVSKASSCQVLGPW